MKGYNLDVKQALHSAVTNQEPTVTFDEIWNGYSHGAEKKRRRKMTAIGAGIIVAAIPLVAYAASVAFSWGGERIDFTNQNWGPYSEAAMPTYPGQELNGNGVETFDLVTSRQMTNSPIREPNKIDGWTNVLSEGVIEPQYNYAVDPKTHKKTLISVTKTPLKYIDIYTNDQGQRIAVTQQYDDPETVALKQSKGLTPIHAIDPGRGFGKDATVLESFDPHGLTVLISGNWSDLPSHVPFHGNYENVVVFHQESDNTVTQITVDEYGNVSTSVLKSFAQAYLNASTQ